MVHVDPSAVPEPLPRRHDAKRRDCSVVSRGSLAADTAASRADAETRVGSGATEPPCPLAGYEGESEDEVIGVNDPRHPQVPRLFDRISRVYDASVLQAVVYRPPQDAILRELRKRGLSRVADVGCGTGILAARIRAELGPEAVYGCDLSAGMLEQARNRSGAVLWMLAPTESLPFRSASLDAVVSSHAFHFFDQAAAVEEFRRVLKPTGIVAVAVMAPEDPEWQPGRRSQPGRGGPFPAAGGVEGTLRGGRFPGHPPKAGASGSVPDGVARRADSGPGALTRRSPYVRALRAGT